MTTVQDEKVSRAPARPRIRRPWSAGRWCAFYRANALALRPLPWDRPAELTPAERAAVAESLQDFQLGESSDGVQLQRRADAYALRTGDRDYSEAIQRFIAEEQRHSRYLGRFLTREGIPLIRSSRLDLVFRWLRHRAGLELFLCILLTAELVGKVYYRVLRRATRSVLLRGICTQLLRDEVQHLRFHAERLACIRRQRSAWLRTLTTLGHRLLLRGTCVAVWCKHRRAFRKGGYTFGMFRQACDQALTLALRQMDPREYQFLDAG
jgi:hypothetical protein